MQVYATSLKLPKNFDELYITGKRQVNRIGKDAISIELSSEKI